MAGGTEPAGGHSEDRNGPAWPTYLPPLIDVGETPLTPVTWCWNAPLWGNPLLPHGRQEGDRAGLEHEHPDLMEYRELRTLGNLVRARARRN